MWTRTATRTLLMAALLTALVAGCDSDSKGEDVSQEALAQMSTMMSNVQSALTTALTQIQFTALTSKEAVAPAQPARTETIDCPQSGWLLIDGDRGRTDTGLSLNLSMEFDECNGINGHLDYVGTSSFTETTYDFSFTMNGSLHEQCTLSYNNFNHEMTINLSAGSSTVVMDGSMGVQCGASSFTCSFDDVTYNTDGSGITALQNSCG